MSAKEYPEMDRRLSMRWSKNVPTKFTLIDGEREVSFGDRQEAYVHNISAGGICIEMEQLDEGMKDELISAQIKIVLEIDIPQYKETILALGRVIWLSKLWKEKEPASGKYVMGLNFLDITTSSRDAIIDYILKSYAGWFKNQ